MFSKTPSFVRETIRFVCAPRGYRLRGEKGSAAQLREIVSVSLLLRLRYGEESTSLLVNELSKDFDDITDALSVI